MRRAARIGTSVVRFMMDSYHARTGSARTSVVRFMMHF